MPESTEYGLIVSFPDQSESFTLGFEAGMIWQRIQNGETHIAATVHTANAEVLKRMADAAGLIASAKDTEIQGWSEFEASPKPKVPALTLIDGGLKVADRKPLLPELERPAPTPPPLHR